MDDIIARDLLSKVNDRGLIGYAYGGGDEDWPLVLEAVRRGLIVYAYDASPGIESPYYGQKRDMYMITAKGKKVLADFKKSDG